MREGPGEWPLKQHKVLAAVDTVYVSRRPRIIVIREGRNRTGNIIWRCDPPAWVMFSAVLQNQLVSRYLSQSGRIRYASLDGVDGDAPSGLL